MKIDTTQVLHDFAGNELKHSVPGPDHAMVEEPITVKLIMINSLLADDDSRDGVSKIRAYDLAQQIYNEDEVSLKTEDAAFVKERILKNFAPMIAGQMSKLIEGEE